MLTLLVYATPTILYVIWRVRQGDDRAQAIADAGAVPGTVRDYTFGLALLVPIALVTWAAWLLEPGADLSGLSVAAVLAPLGIVLGLVRSAGEEILFRGLIGGVLVRRLGFAAGNTLQALIGAVPLGLTLLANGRPLWTVLIGQVVIGWMLGWLRTRLGTCFAGIPAVALGGVLGTLLLVLVG